MSRSATIKSAPAVLSIVNAPSVACKIVLPEVKSSTVAEVVTSGFNVVPSVKPIAVCVYVLPPNVKTSPTLSPLIVVNLPAAAVAVIVPFVATNAVESLVACALGFVVLSVIVPLFRVEPSVVVSIVSAVVPA